MSKKSKCEGCQGHSKVYYCKECIQEGNFYHSGKGVKNLERYADKITRLMQHRNRGKARGDKALTNPPLVLKREKLIFEIEILKERNLHIQKVIEDGKNKKVYAYGEVKRVEQEISVISKKIEGFEDKTKKLKQNIDLYNQGIKEKRRNISEMENKRKNHIQNVLMKRIVDEIFCFEKIILQSSNEDSTNPDITKRIMSIDEAAHTTYVKGRWVTEPHFPNHNFKIAGITLPGSSEYTSFARAQSKDEVSYKKEADHILAGLQYFCTMVGCISFLAKVPLPKSVSLENFVNLSFEDLEKERFQKYVSRLNANVLFLCLSQGVPPSSLIPLNPLGNMYSLITDPNVDIGRFESFESSQSLSDRIEDVDDYDPDTDSDNDDWETVPLTLLPEIQSFTPPRRRISFDETASNVVSSAAASMWNIFGLGNN